MPFRAQRKQLAWLRQEGACRCWEPARGWDSQLLDSNLAFAAAGAGGRAWRSRASVVAVPAEMFTPSWLQVLQGSCLVLCIYQMQVSIRLDVVIVFSCEIRLNLSSEVVAGRHLPVGQPILWLWSAQKKSDKFFWRAVEESLIYYSFETREVSICRTWNLFCLFLRFLSCCHDYGSSLQCLLYEYPALS